VTGHRVLIQRALMRHRVWTRLVTGHCRRRHQTSEARHQVIRSHRKRLLGPRTSTAGGRTDQYAGAQLVDADHDWRYGQGFPDHTGRLRDRVSPNGVAVVLRPAVWVAQAGRPPLTVQSVGLVSRSAGQHRVGLG
jgi:hypothetical protein